MAIDNDVDVSETTHAAGDRDTEVEDEKELNVTPPNRFDVSSYGWDSDVEGLVKRLNRGDIYVPGFQRGFVWNGTEKSRFIESLILGLPVPNVFLAQDSKTKSLNIVDGQQRLRTLQDYLAGRFYLTGKEVQEELKGCYFSHHVAKGKASKVLSDADARALSDAVLHSIVIKPDPLHDDPERGHEYNAAIIQIFRRLNTSGKPLQAQEIRASIFYGALDSLIRQLNKGEAWRELFGKEHPRLKDMELILRFIALRADYSNYRSPMPKFLDGYTETNRNIDDKSVANIEAAFEKVSDLVLNTIGKEGLRSGNTLKVSRFDAVMAGFDEYVGSHSKVDKSKLKSKLKQLEDDEEYKWSIDEFINDTDRVRVRINRARTIFGK